MPNRTIYFYDDVMEYLKTVPEMSKYLNGLVRMDMGGGDEMYRDIEKGGGTPESTPKAKKVVKTKYSPVEISVMKEAVIKRGGKGDGLTTCKNCGSVLPYYKAKCKNC